MDPAQRSQLAFILTLVGGILSLVMGLFFGVMGTFMASVMDWAAKNDPSSGPAPPAGAFLGLFGFFAIVAIAGGITLLVCAPRLRQPMPASRGAAVGAIVGGAICFLSGNVLAAGLGIAGGIVALSEPTAGAAP